MRQVILETIHSPVITIKGQQQIEHPVDEGPIRSAMHTIKHRESLAENQRLITAAKEANNLVIKSHKKLFMNMLSYKFNIKI